MYWQEKKIFYPVLAQLAAKYLCISAVSIASEGLFNTAKHIINDLRNSLDRSRKSRNALVYKKEPVLIYQLAKMLLITDY